MGALSRRARGGARQRPSVGRARLHIRHKTQVLFCGRLTWMRAADNMRAAAVDTFQPESLTGRGVI